MSLPRGVVEVIGIFSVDEVERGETGSAMRLEAAKVSFRVWLLIAARVAAPPEVAAALLLALARIIDDYARRERA